MNDSNSRPIPAHQQLIASVLLAEIAGYDNRPVFEQIDLTSRCRQLIEQGVAENLCPGLINVQGESNVVLLFPGDPADCLRFASWLENILASDVRLNSLPLRVGVNLGPVLLRRDERGEMQASGMGVDDARRVAQSGRLREVLISRAFYTVLSRSTMDDRLLRHRAFVSDELDQSIAVYEIARAKPNEEDFLNTEALGQIAAGPSRKNSRARWSAIAAIALATAGGYSIFDRGTTESTSPSDKIVESAPPAVIAPALKPVANAANIVPEQDPTLIPKTQEVAIVVEPVAPIIAKTKAAPNSMIAREPKVTVQLAIKPWGEIYVDGKKVGVTPPLSNLKLPPGKREILVRNSDFVPFQTTLDVQPESLLLVSHRFDK